MSTEAPKRSANAPTKADLWEELQSSRKEFRELADRATKVIEENTAALVSLHGLVTNLSSLVANLSTQLTGQTSLSKTLMEKTTEVMCQQATGVPMKVFVAVVLVLCLLIAALVGIKASALAPILGGG